VPRNASQLGPSGGAAAALVLAVSACTGLLDYPENQAERGAALCSNGDDDDFDGQLDCADPDCDGACPEESPGACGDGRDNDGDGLADAADPRCFIFSPPRVERCAEAPGTDLYETFDAGDLGLPTSSFQWIGTRKDDGAGVIWNAFRPNRVPGTRAALGGRQDRALLFWHNTTGEEKLDGNLGAAWRLHAFSGSWEGFEMGFVAAVPPETLVRAAVVPVELAPPFGPPRPGAETSLLAVTVDATRSPPTLSLDVAGARYSTPLTFTSALCSATTLCNGYEGRVQVVRKADGFVATLRYPNGAVFSVSARGAPSPTLPLSRLVLWGGSTTRLEWALLDDLRLRVRPRWPCGFHDPTIPGGNCESMHDRMSFGRHATLGRSRDGVSLCALVTEENEGLARAESLVAWHSRDGSGFERAATPGAPTISLPDGAKLIGAGIAADDGGWHAAVTYRTGSTSVELAFADGETCGGFGPLGAGLRLPDDSGGPSLIASDLGQDVYFTRAPGAGQAPALWRVSRQVLDRAPELMATLPANASAASITLAGARDPLLAYVSPGAGLGLLVGTEDFRSFMKIEPSPLLPAPPRPTDYERWFSFDDQAITTAALAFGSEGGGLLMYTGTTEGPGFGPRTAVGTARLIAANDERPEGGSSPPSRCGDARCTAGESCASCAGDCSCARVLPLDDVFAKSKWHVRALDPYPEALQYFDADPPLLNVTGGNPAWLVRPLDREVSGDFELSFDVRPRWVNRTRDTPCATYVGLGTAPHITVLPPLGVRQGEGGIFVRIAPSSYCSERFVVMPVTMTAGAPSSIEETKPAAPSSCSQGRLVADHAQRVTLRREEDTVTLRFTLPDGCESAGETLAVRAAPNDLAALYIGSGGNGFDTCLDDAGSLTLENLELRSLEAP
jgi:hypothetical protein